MSKKEVPVEEITEAIDKAANKIATKKVVFFALGSTILATATLIVTANILLNRMTTDDDWSNLDWSMDEEDGDLL